MLELLARHTRPVATMTIARECAIPKSSAHHLLNVMKQRNFVTYYAGERAWGLGVSAFEIGSAYLRSEPLQRLGRHILSELAHSIGETSHLAILRGTEVLYIDKEQPIGSATQLVTEIGVRLPAHLTAVGRAILAELAEAQVRALYANQPLIKRTDRGPGDLDELLHDLTEIRVRGYAFDDELVTPGIACLASPIFSHEGIPVAALGVTYVAAQRPLEKVALAATIVVQMSERLSSSLGYVPPATGRTVAG